MTNRIVHEKYMQRCLDLAIQGFANTAPNPMVGSLVVYKNKIIGEGYHRKLGGPHAEVNAINSIKDKSILKKSTLYVSLEPCAHYGKTPPCANLIAGLGIPNVVIGTIDTAAHVSGKGIKILKNAGCNVTVGILESQCRELNKRFFTFHEKNRPYIILKWAQTIDGFIDIEANKKHKAEPTWITNDYAKKLVHKWRAEEQAILVGTNTAKSDNPSLTTRNWEGRNPLRIVLDRRLILSPNLKIFNINAETIIVADIMAKNQIMNKYNDNIGIIFVNYEKDFYNQLFEFLKGRNIQSIIVEGGEKVLNSFVGAGYWDEARVFQGNIKFGNGVSAPQISINEYNYEKVGNSKLMFIKNYV